MPREKHFQIRVRDPKFGHVLLDVTVENTIPYKKDFAYEWFGEGLRGYVEFDSESTEIENGQVLWRSVQDAYTASCDL